MERDTETQSEKEGTVEEGAKQLCTCPTKCKILRGDFALCYLHFYKSDDEADQIVELIRD